MDATDQGRRLFGAQRSLHGLLGGSAGEPSIIFNQSVVGSWLVLVLFELLLRPWYRNFLWALADVVLWRRKEVAGGSLAGVAASWALFYCVPGYTLLPFVSRVSLIALAVLFAWAKAARLLNRAPPPVALMKISEASASVAAAAVGTYLNKTLQGFENIALGKDSSLFYNSASVRLMSSVVGRLTDLITLV